MKALFAVVLAVAAVLQAPTAYAIARDPFVGTWSLQGLNFNSRLTHTSTLGGAAIIRSAGAGQYDIEMVANQTDTQVSDGHSWITTAIERCRGVAQNLALTITCEIVSVPTPEYSADSFSVSSDSDGHLTGTANDRVSVEFTRVD